MFKEDICYKVYNTDSKRVIGAFKTMTEAAGFMGVTLQRFHLGTIRGDRFTSPHFTSKLVVRYGNPKELDKEYLFGKIIELEPTCDICITDMNVVELLNYYKDLKLKSNENILGSVTSRRGGYKITGRYAGEWA